MSELFNIASWISEHAKTRPDQTAILFPLQPREKDRKYASLSFLQTEKLIDRYARGLSAIGIQKGDRVSLFVPPSLEFMPLTFALYKIGAVVVLIDPGMGKKGLLSSIETIKPKVLVGIGRAMLASVIYRKAFRSVKIKVTVGGRRWLWGGHKLDDIKSDDDSPFEGPPTTREDEASILFTSGSTGPAKGVRYTHGVFDAQTTHIQQMYGIQSGEVDLPCFPLFGLFSLAMGMTVVIPDMDPTKPALADPSLLVQAIKQHNITNAFASPALWKGFVKWCLDSGVSLPTLNRVLSAGAPIPPQLHRDFSQILREKVQVHTPYGATESLPVASIGTTEVLTETAEITLQGKGICVGHLAPNIKVRIIGISDDVISDWNDDLCLPDGQIGEICVSGPVVTTEYKELPEKTRMAKIYNPDGSLWHRIGDVGYFDAKGRLWFCGRKSHRVNCADGKVMFPVPCEALFNEHPAVNRSALVEVEQKPVIIIEGVSADKTTEELLKLAQEHDLTSRIKTVLYHQSFPVDLRHNAKIHRLQLRDWARKQV